MADYVGITALSQKPAELREDRGRSLSWGWVAVIVGAVLYGSLIPFEIDRAALAAPGGIGFPTLAWSFTTVSDVITNWVVYVPVGLAAALCGPARRRGSATLLAISLLVGAALSILVESIQTVIVERVASWPDVGCNCAGALTGGLAALGVRRWGTHAALWARLALCDRPFAVGATVLTMGLVVHGLAPFDFVRTTAGLQDSFLQADWDLTSPRTTGVDNVSHQVLGGKPAGAAWFSLLAYLNAFANLQRRRRPIIAWASAMKHTMVVIVVLEFMRLFTVSQTFDLAAMLLGLSAALLGAWLAVFLIDPATHGRWREEIGHALPTILLPVVAVFQIGVLLLGSVDMQVWSAGGFDAAVIRWLPFEAMWHGSMIQAGCGTATALVTFGVLTVTVGTVLCRVRVSRAWVVAGVVVTLLAVFAEYLRGASAVAVPDLTGPVLAMIASGLAIRAVAMVKQAAPDRHGSTS